VGERLTEAPTQETTTSIPSQTPRNVAGLVTSPVRTSLATGVSDAPRGLTSRVTRYEPGSVSRCATTSLPRCPVDPATSTCRGRVVSPGPSWTSAPFDIFTSGSGPPVRGRGRSPLAPRGSDVTGG